jgi:DNA-binding beta-propeller fold protein YncE
MTPRGNPRVIILGCALLIGAFVLIAREHRPSFLRPGLQLNAYVATSDGSLTVVDLVKLRAIHRIPIGPALSGVREHPIRPEIWGVSSQGGYVWIVDGRSNQRRATIPVGDGPYAVDFSSDGRRAYTTSSGSDALVAIDCESRAIVGRARTGREPVFAQLTPDEKSILVLNHRDATLGIHDAATLAQRGKIPVVAQPDEVLVMPDSSIAFVLSRREPRMSVVDLRREVLLSNLQLAGKPSDMLLKPDGGELYVISPDSHGLQVINTWTHEVGDYMMLGDSPTRGILSADTSLMYITDAAAGRVTAVDINNRRVVRNATGTELLVSVGQSPSAVRFDPAENLLLVVNHDSGDLAVIRARPDNQSLLTLIPVGEHPRDLAVKLF